MMVMNHMIDVLRKHEIRRPDDGIVLENITVEVDGEPTNLLDMVPDPRQVDGIERARLREGIAIVQAAMGGLSVVQQQALLTALSTGSDQEAADSLGIGRRKLRGRLQKARELLREKIQQQYSDFPHVP